MEFNNIFLFLGGLGGTEILLILFVILLLFGAKRIPELAKGLGRGIREFKDATTEIKNDMENHGRDDKKTAHEAPAPEVHKTDARPEKTPL